MASAEGGSDDDRDQEPGSFDEPAQHSEADDAHNLWAQSPHTSTDWSRVQWREGRQWAFLTSRILRPGDLLKTSSERASIRSAITRLDKAAKKGAGFTRRRSVKTRRIWCASAWGVRSQMALSGESGIHRPTSRTSVVTTGRPEKRASFTTLGDPSQSEVRRQQSAAL